ncbi:MAG: group II intron maturase-specific domain-containing protein [Flavonifractor plautii]
MKALKSALSETILGRGKAWKQEVLIEKLNQQIRGWTNYHQSVCASEAFAHIDYILYELLWRWAKRRHPHKGQWWISTNYWHRKGNRNWVFCTEDKELLRVDHIPIVRHTKVRMDANPYLTQYFMDRKFQQGINHYPGVLSKFGKTSGDAVITVGFPWTSATRGDFLQVPKPWVATKCAIWPTQTASKSS